MDEQFRFRSGSAADECIRDIADTVAHSNKRSLKVQRTARQRRNRRVMLALWLFDAGLVVVIVAMAWGKG